MTFQNLGNQREDPKTFKREGTKKVTTSFFHNNPGRDEAMLSNAGGKMFSENLHPNCQLSIDKEQRYFQMFTVWAHFAAKLLGDTH